MVKSSEKLIRILIDGDKFPKLLDKHGVTGYPTIKFFDPDGKEVGELNGRDAGSVSREFEDVAQKYSRGPKWGDSAEKALESGKSDSKPAVLFFGDDKPKSALFLAAFGDASLKPELWEKAIFAKHAFKKDDETCKKWKVTEAPTLLIVDNTGDEAKVLKTLKSAKPADLKKAIEEAAKAMEKK